MSNRGRQNVASYLAHDLGADWRAGAAWFESRLVDYDVCSNWGNWVAAAGLAPGRAAVFNIVKQVGFSAVERGRMPEMVNLVDYNVCSNSGNWVPAAPPSSTS